MVTNTLSELEKLIASRMASYRAGELKADDSRVVKALTGPEEELLRKLPEEAVEVLLAVTHKGNLVSELADLWFYCLLVMHQADVPVQTILVELASRLPAEDKNKG